MMHKKAIISLLRLHFQFDVETCDKDATSKAGAYYACAFGSIWQQPVWKNKQINPCMQIRITFLLINKLFETSFIIQIQNNVWSKEGFTSQKKRSIIFQPSALHCLFFCVICICVSHALSHLFFLRSSWCALPTSFTKLFIIVHHFLSNTNHTKYTTTYNIQQHTYIFSINNKKTCCLLYFVSMCVCVHYFILFYFWRASANFAARFPPLRWGGGCPPLRWGGAYTVWLPIGVWRTACGDLLGCIQHIPTWFQAYWSKLRRVY
jgi:hypothetical protein